MIVKRGLVRGLDMPLVFLCFFQTIDYGRSGYKRKVLEKGNILHIV